MKGTERELSDLHGLVARKLTEKLEETVTITNEDGETETINTATAQDIATAITFLKHNNITASVADDENLQGLEEKLAENRKRRPTTLRAVGEE